MTESLLETLRANAAGFVLEAPFDAETELRRCEDLGIRLVTRGSEGYPPLLSAIEDPPAVLYLRGSLEAPAGLAFVGSRRPTPYGLRASAALAAEAAAAGILTVSGLARGIDTEVHRASLAEGGPTWAVLGSGLDRVYPPENARLAEEIVSQGGAVLTEVPLGGAPLKPNFPRRNRIISGLAWATVVVEGDYKSGSLITARRALDQGREVLAVPGPIDSSLSDGPNKLLFDGAPPARCLLDILGVVPMLRPASLIASRARRKTATPTAEEKKILELLGSEARGLDDLVRESGLDVPNLTRVLMEMEVKELVGAHPGQRYARR